MLKKFASFVLASVKPSTGTRPPHRSAARTNLVLLIRRTVRLRGYASGFDSPAALSAERRVSERRGWAGEISDLYEHPAWYFPVILDMRIREAPACLQSSPEAC
jgi:hypothetical protein